MNKNTPLLTDKGKLSEVSHKLLNDFVNLTTTVGIDLENFFENLFKSIGYNVEITAKYDNGVDLLIDKNGNSWIVQVKGTTIEDNLISHKNLIGKSIVEKYIGSYAKYSAHFNKVIITNGLFNEGAKEKAKQNNIELIDRVGLIYLIAKIKPELITKAYIENDHLEKCPQCHNYKVLQKNTRTYQEFLSCENYKNCGYSETYIKKQKIVYK